MLPVCKKLIVNNVEKLNSMPPKALIVPMKQLHGYYLVRSLGLLFGVHLGDVRNVSES